MKRGPRGDELTPPLSGDNMLSAVRRIAGVGLGTPLQFEDQTAALLALRALCDELRTWSARHSHARWDWD
jgi:hypothetical protein